MSIQREKENPFEESTSEESSDEKNFRKEKDTIRKTLSNSREFFEISIFSL